MNDKQIFTDSGIEVKQVYTAADQAAQSSALPGEFPYTRGIQPDMYRGKLWTMRQYAGFSTAEESNKRYHYLLSQGVMGLSVAFDLPTQIGYDSDHALAEGEVGKVGVAIDSIEDMKILFQGIKLEEVSTSMTINATGFILLAFYVALAKQQGADLKKIAGTIQNDILKEYAARGTYIYPPKPSMRIITDIFEWCSKELPKWKRSIMALGSVAPRSFIILAHILLAARNLATSSKKLLCPLKKKERRFPNTLISSPLAIAASTYALPLLSVNAISCTAVLPASRIW